MSIQKPFGHVLTFSCAAMLCALIIFATQRDVAAQQRVAAQQTQQIILQNNIGGVVIDPDGVLQKQLFRLDTELYRDLIAKLQLAPDELQEDVKLRKISLRRLQESIALALSDGSQTVPQEIQFLAGLHRVQYILVYPDLHDIVLAGPGGGWTADEQGRVVGSHGEPVLQLDDLIVALRTIFGAGSDMISCSINPTRDGIQQYQRVVSKQRRFHPGVLPALEQALGPQTITVTGVPSSSHFAHVLVAADYGMKRIAMGLDPSPIRRLSGYLELIKSARSVKNAMPRWWLACDYESLARSEDGFAWEIRGSGVKCLTENAFLQPDGTIRKEATTDPAASQWAQRMTAEYSELSAQEPVFTELRQLMDFCVLAALIREKGLHIQADCDLSLLTEEHSGLITYVGNAPRTVPSQASVVKRGRDYIISASGGVEIDAWSVVEQSDVSSTVQRVRESAASDAKRASWWWN